MTDEKQPEKFILDKRGRFVKIGGQAPADSTSERRCQATRRCGLQCRRWARKESRYCSFHGARSKKNRKYWNQHVARFYKRSISEGLNAAIEEHLNEKPDDQLMVFEELALLRHAANHAVHLYDLSLQSKNPEAIQLATSLMVDNLKTVVEVCKSATQIASVQKDKFSVHDLAYIIEQIIRISHDVFCDYPDLAARFAVSIRSSVSLSQSAATTQLTTDTLVREMDSASLGLPNVEAT